MNIQDIPNTTEFEVDETARDILLSALSKEAVDQNDSGIGYVREKLDAFSSQALLLSEISKRASALVNRLDIRSDLPQLFSNPEEE